MPTLQNSLLFFLSQTSCLNKSLVLKWIHELEREKIIEYDFCPHREYLSHSFTFLKLLFYIYALKWPKRRRGLLRNCIFLVRVQAAKTSFQTFYWSSRTALQQLIQWTVRINRFWRLGFVHKIHIHLEATSPLYNKSNAEICILKGQCRYFDQGVQR